MTTTDQFVIREFTEQDRDAVNASIRELQDHERRIEPRMKHTDAIIETGLDTLLAHCAEKQGAILVAETSGKVTGYVCVHAKVANEDPDEIDYDYAYVVDLAIDQAHRGKGMGSALLEAAERYAVDQGARYLRISALAGNDGAVKLYQRTGFAPRVIELEKTLGSDP